MGNGTLEKCAKDADGRDDYSSSIMIQHVNAAPSQSIQFQAAATSILQSMNIPFPFVKSNTHQICKSTHNFGYLLHMCQSSNVLFILGFVLTAIWNCNLYSFSFFSRFFFLRFPSISLFHFYFLLTNV